MIRLIKSYLNFIFFFSDHITPIISTLPALFAKSSVVWSTLLYMFTNKTIKSKILKTLIFSKNNEKKLIQLSFEIQTQKYLQIFNNNQSKRIEL